MMWVIHFKHHHEINAVVHTGYVSRGNNWSLDAAIKYDSYEDAKNVIDEKFSGSLYAKSIFTIMYIYTGVSE